MKLVLAEKPSVAQSIAKVLGAAKREDGYLEGNGYVVSWCVGHLVELAQPEVYDAKYSKWAYADLPIFPMDWQYEVSAGTKKQFGILKKLMAREDVASLVCATDAGREGELIFRLVYHKAGCRKPFERLWISSMEDVAIKEGFENLRSGTEYDALYEAALCRERADWIVGINATRLFSTLYGQTLNVGRVMTPTLAMAVMREAAISAFKPELFYTVQIGLDGFTAASERFKTKAAAEAVKQSCSVAIVQKAECKEKTEKPPALDIKTICPLHGPVLTGDLGKYLNYYDLWSSYKAEEPEKVLVASASIHGHTRAAAHILAEKLRAKGAKVVEMDLTRTDVSYAVTEAFRCGKTVLACATYDGFLFPPMENLLTHLKTKAFQSRTIALMENGTWAPMAAKLMRAELDGMKNITVCDTVVTLRSASNAAAEAQMDAMVEELLSK